MSEYTISHDSKIVKVLAAQANSERLETQTVEDAEKLYASLYNNPTPDNRYMIAQLVTFAVNERIQKETDWRKYIADERQIGEGDEAIFRVRHRGIKAFIQADGATTPATRVAHSNIVLPTKFVSARPICSLRELRAGKIRMSDLVVAATNEIVNTENKYIEQTLLAAAQNWGSPFYAAGAGVVAETIDPMIVHWMRTGGAVIVGDYAAIQKLAPLTGFAASTTDQQFSPDIINEFNKTGRIGSYKGASVVQFVNAYDVDGITPIMSDKYLYILPLGTRAEDRPLKVVRKGKVLTVEATNIDDLTFEMRMDEAFGAGIAYGDTPEMSVYYDQTT